MKLARCPCGRIPNELEIQEGASSNWAFVYGDCCNEWCIEFKTHYNLIYTNECMDLAIAAWNDATRDSML